jgi:2-methylisocitrate lyase-like PEP mutase family enzyme
LILFGAYDALSARLIARAGCPACFISGFSVVGSRFGVPDVGLRAFGDISGAVRDILQVIDLPVLVDADDGDGDVKNVVHTVQTYERMGVGAIMIEDQTWPKRCGHMAGKKCNTERGSRGQDPQPPPASDKTQILSSWPALMRVRCTGWTKRCAGSSVI